MFDKCTSLYRESCGDNGNDFFWILKITYILLKTTTRYFFGCTFFYILSQVSMLAAILLPWKLLIIMTTDGYSWGLPEVLHTFPERQVVLALVVAALLAFLLYAISEFLISLLCQKGSAFILDKNQKMRLFSGHRKYASQLYRRFLRAVSAVFTVSLIMMCLFFIYPFMLLSLITYLLIGVAIVIWQRCSAPQDSFFPALPPDLKAAIWWGLGFFYAVFWLIANYWHGTLPTLTTAFVSLLLVRQAIVLIFPAFSTYMMFIKAQHKVNALFLSDIPWSPKPETDNGFTALLESECLEIWVSSLLSKYDDTLDRVEVVSCRMSSAGKVALIIISSTSCDQKKSFLVKLFHSSVEESMRHERDILEAIVTDPIAPHFCGADIIEGHFCHVFEWPLQAGWMSAKKRSAQLPEIREKLLSIELPNELVLRYERSRPHLSDRLKLIEWDLLISISPKTFLEECQQLQHYWPDICNTTRLQPRQVVIPRIHQHLIGHCDNKSLICNWTRWLWEPVGAGWPLNTSETEFQQALYEAEKQRPYLTHVSANRAGLTSLLYEFERLWRIKKHSEAVKLIAPMYESAKNSNIVNPG